MKEDELVGKLVKDYRLNEDEDLVAVILEDGIEIRPTINRKGYFCLQIQE